MTSDDFEPRRDGLFEHRGTWGEVTVGTVIANRERRSQRWEIIEVSMATQVQFGFTLWMRAREQTTGEEFTVKPRLKVSPVTILTTDPRDTQTAPPTAPSDADAIMLLVKELGAEILASRDNETGEIVCPDYVAQSHIPGFGEGQCRRGLVEHLKFAHQTEVADDADLVSLYTMHGHAHDPRWPNIGKAGFPHRHVPEDMTIY